MPTSQESSSSQTVEAASTTQSDISYTPQQIQQERAKLAATESRLAEAEKESKVFKRLEAIYQKSPEVQAALQAAIDKENMSQVSTGTTNNYIPQQAQQAPVNVEEIYHGVKTALENDQGWAEFLVEHPEMDITKVKTQDEFNRMREDYLTMGDVAVRLRASGMKSKDAYNRALYALYPEKIAAAQRKIGEVIGKNEAYAAQTGVVSGNQSSGNSNGNSSGDLSGLSPKFREKYQDFVKQGRSKVFLESYVKNAQKFSK
jgi:hypothetical protein